MNTPVVRSSAKAMLALLFKELKAIMEAHGPNENLVGLKKEQLRAFIKKNKAELLLSAV